MRRFLFALLLVVVPLCGNAGDDVGHWYVDPYIGGISPDREWAGTSASRLDFGVAIGKHLTSAVSAEVDFNHTSLADRSNPGHTKLDAGALNVLGVFDRNAVFAPYGLLGAGVLHESSGDPLFTGRTGFMAQAGVGAFIELWRDADGSRSFSLRPDIKVRWSAMSSSPVDLLYVLGFTFAFGHPSAAAVAATAPLAASPPAPARPLPAPPPAASRCPGTPPGVPVDEYGCPLKGADVVLEGVTFETGSAELTADSKPVLKTLAGGLREHPRLKIEVHGHTDSTGLSRYNLQLSQRRADAVRDFLERQGVPPAQMTAKGFGETRPVASNATADGRARNRRVVMHVIDNPGKVTVQKEGEAQP